MTQTARPLSAVLAACLVTAAVLPASASPSAAPEPPPTVSVDPDPQGASGLIHASVDINAPPQMVWSVMVDCARVPKLMVNVQYCKVLQRDPAGRWDLREQVTRASLLPSVRTVMHSDYDEPRSVKFHRTDGDFKILDGEWRLEPLDGGARTRVMYESRMSSPFAAPSMIVRAVLRRDMPHTLNNLRDASEALAHPAKVAVNARP